MVLCSSHEILSLKFLKKLAGPPIFNSRSNGWTIPFTWFLRDRRENLEIRS
jgi:hypothetical protein